MPEQDEQQPMTLRWLRGDDLVRVQARHLRDEQGGVSVPSLFDMQSWTHVAVQAVLGDDVAFSLVVVSTQERRSWDAEALPGRTDVTYRIERQD